jgi:DNA repair protein RadC
MYEWTKHKVRVIRENESSDAPSMIKGDVSLHEAFSRHAADNDQESFWVVAMNLAGEVIGVQELYRGQVGASVVRTAEVFRLPILMQAASFCVVHNHPSGQTTPSSDDIKLTIDLYASSKMLEIEFHDHLVVSKDGYTSIRKFSDENGYAIWDTEIQSIFVDKYAGAIA